MINTKTDEVKKWEAANPDKLKKEDPEVQTGSEEDVVAAMKKHNEDPKGKIDLRSIDEGGADNSTEGKP